MHKNYKKEIEQNFIFDEVHSFYQNKAIVRIENYWFNIDTTGKILFKIKADVLIRLNENLFAVRINDKWGIINNNKEYIIEPKYDDLSPTNDYLYVVKLVDKYGVVNQNDENTIEIKYDNLNTVYLNRKCYLEAKYNDKYGIISLYDDIIIPFEYDEHFEEDYIYPNLLIATKNGKMGLINFKNKIIIPFDYTNLARANKYKIFADNKIIDFKNKYLYDFNVDYLDVKLGCGENRFCVKKDGKIGFVDEFEELKIDYKYTNISFFRDGFCEVENDNNAGLIDKNDNLILPFEYDVCSLSFLKNDLFRASKDYKFGLIDKNNKTVADFIFDDMSYDFSNGYITTNYNNKWGFIDENGNPLKINAKDFTNELDTVEKTKFILGGKVLA